MPVFEVGRVCLALFLPITDASVKSKTNSATKLVTTDNSFCNTVTRLYTQTTDFIEDICGFHITTHTQWYQVFEFSYKYINTSHCVNGVYKIYKTCKMFLFKTK